MQVEFKRDFEKGLKQIKDGKLLTKIRDVIEEVENVHNLSEASNIKKIKAEGDYYRIRVGDYRIGISLTEDIVIFVCIFHRKEIYRYFP